MDYYALRIANELLRFADKKGANVTQLRLMKLVYICHGYILALLDKNTNTYNVEDVEAWDYGPVFPSVYLEFRKYKDKPVLHKAMREGEEVYFDKSHSDERLICEMVWNKWGSLTVHSLVEQVHEEGSPWSQYYIKGMNVVIPDFDTKLFYQILVKYQTEKK